MAIEVAVVSWKLIASQDGAEDDWWRRVVEFMLMVMTRLLVVAGDGGDEGGGKCDEGDTCRIFFSHSGNDDEILGKSWKSL